MIVVNLVGDPVHGLLAESRFVPRAFLPGGEHNMYELAFALAVAGHPVELRGWLDQAAFARFRDALGVAPATGLPARAPNRDDIVVVPEGWSDPLDYLRLLLSEARLAVFLLAPPGLFGWPFVAPGWAPPDPLTVPLDAVAAPEHFIAMERLGCSLLTHSPGLAHAAADSGVSCTFVGTGRPAATLAEPRPDREIDAAAVMSNRWAPLVQGVLAELEGPRLDPIGESANGEILERLARSRVLVWPSRIEGHATIPWEARTVGCVPVALSSNRFAVGLSDDEGAVVVDRVEDIAPAVRQLLDDPARWQRLSRRAVEVARREVDWDSYVERVAGWVESVPQPAPDLAARGGMGAALAAWLTARAVENQAVREELQAELDRVRADRDQWSERASEFELELDRVRVDRDQWHRQSRALEAELDALSKIPGVGLARRAVATRRRTL